MNSLQHDTSRKTTHLTISFLEWDLNCNGFSSSGSSEVVSSLSWLTKGSGSTLAFSVGRYIYALRLIIELSEMDTNQATNILNYLQKRLSSSDIGMSMAREVMLST